MPISTDEFWKLAVASGLLSSAGCQELHAEFNALKGASRQDSAATLAEWLVASGALSRYQASILLSGRPGPFVFGDFVIVERIETGRLARTFRAIYKNTQPVLLVFASTIVDGPRQTRSTIERFKAAKAIKSPHVSRVYQFIAAAAPPFFVLEDLQGQNVHEYLAANKPAYTEACRMGFQAALALVAMQDLREVHGNVCPENLWVDPAGTVKLLQFPLTHPAWGSERLQAPAVDYLAPELADGACPPDAITDIYSLGCALYELIAGRVPFPGGTVREKLERHRTEVPQRVDRLVAGVDENLADLVAEMLDKEPMRRAQTASYVSHLLAPFAAGAAERRAGSPPRTTPQGLTPGYGAWREPGWEAPPQQTQPPRTGDKIEAKHAASTATEPETPIIVVDSKAGETSVVAPAGAAVVKRRRANATAIGVGAGLVVIVGIVLGGFLLARRDSTATPGATTARDGTRANAKTTRAAADAPAANPVAKGAGVEDSLAARSRGGNSSTGATGEIDDDGRTLWASPTAGKPLSMRYLPSSAQVLLALRPADVLANAEGAKIIDSLGPAGQLAKDRLQATLGVQLADVEQLTIAFVPDDAGMPQAAYMMRLVEPLAEQALLEAWGKPPAAAHKSKPFYQNARLAYYLPAEGNARTVAVAPPVLMREILERDGEPLLRQGIETLLRASDDARHFNLLAAPSYLLTDGKSLLAGDLAKLREPLARFLDMSLQAVLASAHLGDELFLELRAAGAVDQRPEELATLLHARLESASEQVEHYVASLAPRPYGRLVINRFPRMVQLASSFTRAGAEDRQAVLRCYLPASAAHNLLFGAELTLFEEPAVVDQAQAPPAVGSRSGSTSGVAAALDKKISLSFPRDTLERSMEMLAGEIDVPIVILGGDLQLEGITKNQSFGLDERDRVAREILRKVLELANPDGKLVYVIKPGEDRREAIFITTRAAASKRGDRLPAELVVKTPAKKP